MTGWWNLCTQLCATQHGPLGNTLTDIVDPVVGARVADRTAITPDSQVAVVIATFGNSGN